MTEQEAKRRFMMINAVRFVALLFVMAGAANIAEKWLPDLAPGLGAVLMIVGVADFFLAPVLLKRLWNKPVE